jgi:hypothetical protein
VLCPLHNFFLHIYVKTNLNCIINDSYKVYIRLINLILFQPQDELLNFNIICNQFNLLCQQVLPFWRCQRSRKDPLVKL